MSQGIIQTSNMPGFENPELRKEIDRDNEAFLQEQQNATPETTEKMKEDVSKIFGNGFDPKKDISSIKSLEEQDSENPDDILDMIDVSEDFSDNKENVQTKYTTQSSGEIFEESKENSSNNEIENSPNLRQENISETNENQEIITSNSPYYPIALNLKNSGDIDNQVFDELVENLNNNSLEEGKNYFLSVVDNIDNREVKTTILDSFEGDNEINEDNFESTDFYNHSQELNIDLENGVGGLEIMLAQNYIAIPDIDGKTDKSRDIIQSMDVSLNTIITNNSNDFEKNNSVLIQDIKKETNLSKKYESLKTLYNEDLKEDAKLGGKKGAEEIGRRKTSLIEKAKKINDQIIEARKISDNNKREQTLEELNQEKQQIIEEGQGIDNFEAEIQMLSGGEMDKSNESKENKENN